ncbi:hypothetical protein [Halalkalibacter lacteus]|uniref:hypothetical protein n=1 Tax=Halalkalibacter lacteus TaxID=3090663 RepID=UPI002FC7B9F4
MNNLIDIYKDIIFKLLLTSNGRTTDILEVLAEEGLQLIVSNQTIDHELLGNGETTKCILRESHILTRESKFILSHNYAKIYPEFTPDTLSEKIFKKKEGIGSNIKEMDIISTRRIINYGWRESTNVVNLLNEKTQIVFDCKDPIPFKEYVVSFEQNGHSGIHLIEYFNPNILFLMERKVKEPQNLLVK